MSQGMSVENGRPLTGIDHLVQSIRDILTTPLNTRVQRRDYGSRLFELIDSPINARNLIEVYVATAEALERWEPRFKLDRVQVQGIEPGHLIIRLEGEYLPANKKLVLEGIQI